MTRPLVLVCATVSTVLLRHVVHALPQYVTRVPNGDQVAGIVALGHANRVGGGELNRFGMDFATAAYQWTEELCTADSDGDGATNGEELGDPCCTWRSMAASLPSNSATFEATHPGVADAWTTDALTERKCQTNVNLALESSSGSTANTSDMTPPPTTTPEPQRSSKPPPLRQDWQTTPRATSPSRMNLPSWYFLTMAVCLFPVLVQS